MADTTAAENPKALGEYTDANGNTFQLNEADAKRLGFSRVESKIVEAEAETKPSRRALNYRPATTK